MPQDLGQEDVVGLVSELEAVAFSVPLWAGPETLFLNLRKFRIAWRL